jgi:uncharacterized protein (TIGR03000 family)
MSGYVLRALIAACLMAALAGRALAWGRGGYHGHPSAGGGYHGNRATGVGVYLDVGPGLWSSPAPRATPRGGNFAPGISVSPGLEGYDSFIQAPVYATASAGGYGHLTAAEATAHPTLYYDPSSLARSAAAVRKGFAHAQAFTSAWWRTQPQAWRPSGWKVSDAWVWATWPDLQAWLGIDAAPIYFDYGNTIVYQGDEVKSDFDGPVLATAAQYYQQAADLAQSGRPTTDKEDSWKALGVYALVLGESAQASVTFQLAVNKGGQIRGNAFYLLAGTTLDVRGAVDMKTQRVAWVVGDNKATVFDTGLVNLTKDAAPVLIHFGKDRTQEWLLVRIQETDQQPVVVAKADPLPAPTADQEPATVILSVPADAEVWFDGAATSQEGTERTFRTPPLAKGGHYHYTLRARWTEDGKPVDESRTVSVRAGEQVRLRFPLPAAGK